MSIQKELKKEGIEIITKLDTLISNDIIKNVSRRIVETFPDFSLNQEELCKELSQITMYRAKMVEGMAEANYYYKDSSIYFNENIDYSDIEEFAIHECIHHIQKIQDNDGKLLRLGLCTYNNLKPTGLALNEAAVQYTSCIVIGVDSDFEKFYGISLVTPSPSYYPLECSLLNQLIFFTGNDILFKSTLFSTDDFKNKIIEMTSEKTYKKILVLLDSILKYEEKIVVLNNKVFSLKDGDSKADIINKKIETLKEKIATNYIKTQNIIIKEFFDYEFNKISNLEELEQFRHKLSDFSELIGTTPNYTFFDNYYIETMNRLEHKCNVLENGGHETALSRKRANPILAFLQKLFKFKTSKKIDA